VSLSCESTWTEVPPLRSSLVSSYPSSADLLCLAETPPGYLDVAPMCCGGYMPLQQLPRSSTVCPLLSPLPAPFHLLCLHTAPVALIARDTGLSNTTMDQSAPSTWISQPPRRGSVSPLAGQSHLFSCHSLGSHCDIQLELHGTLLTLALHDGHSAL
jgi:hypothetical protein